MRDKERLTAFVDNLRTRRIKKDLKILRETTAYLENSPVERFIPETEYLKGFTYFEQTLTPTAVAPEWSEEVLEDLSRGERERGQIIGIVKGKIMRWSTTAAHHDSLDRLDRPIPVDLYIQVKPWLGPYKAHIRIEKGGDDKEEKVVETLYYLQRSMPSLMRSEVWAYAAERNNVLIGYKGLLSDFSGELGAIR